MKFAFLPTAVLLLLVSCASNRPMSLERIKEFPEHRLETFVDSFRVSMGDRILKAPDCVIDFLRKMDSTDAYGAHEATEEEKRLFLDYYSGLPPRIRSVMEDKLAAILFIEKFVGGGMSDFVFDKDGNMFIVLYLNPETAHATLSEWIGYRDSSTFADDGSGMRIRVECEGAGKGLLHTLTHEASHIYDYYHHATPYTEGVFKEGPGVPAKTDFTDGIWKDYGTPRPEYDFGFRTEISGYGLGRKTGAANALPLLQSLGKTPFSSLYGSSSWAEDFAETVTWYCLAKNYGVTYSVSARKDGVELARYSPSANALVTARYGLVRALIE